MSNETRQGKRQERRKVKKKKRSPLKIFLISLLILFVTAGGVVAFYVNSIGNKITSKSKIEAKKVKKGEPVNFLLLGVDAGDYNGKDEHQRSDTMMLIRFIPETDKIYILSIPRDTKLKIKGKTQKINAAHAIGGPELTINTVEDLLDVKINYYGSINYEGFRKCVDAIGGVQVVVPRDMKYNASDIKIDFKKGETVLLDGENAEKFVRWRKDGKGGGYPTGDVGRAETQQVFMVEFLKKLKSPQGLTKLKPLIDTVAEYSETNMDLGTIMSYGTELMNVDLSTIEKEVLAGEAKKENGVWYYIYDEKNAQDFLNNFRDSSGMSSSGNKNTPLNNENLDINIYNATGVQGLASQYKERLKKLGFNVGEPRTESNKKDKTEIRYGGEEYSISSLKNYLTDVKYIKDSKLKTGEVKIILGKDAVNGGILIGSSPSYNDLDQSSIKNDKSVKNIKILNSTNHSGLAAKYKEKLEHQGYKVVGIDNYSQRLNETQIKYKNDKEFANDVANSIGAGKVKASSDMSVDITVILGSDAID